MKLMIVESPAKAKTIEKYLGKDFKVLASYGHIRDLVSKDGSVDPDRDFAMKWHIDSVGNKHIAAIEKAIKTADEVFLATDPDREGEAISWHLVEILKDKLHVPVKRVVFHEITKSAVTKAISDPRGLDINLVEAYLARRALDYLVGFKLSPILWRKLPKSKSAGRVQSVALRLIYERECEIDKFKSEEYWDVVGNFSSKKGGLSARLITFDGKKLEKLSIKNELEAKKIKDSLLHEQYAIASIDRKVTYRKPFAPFITSTLQQEASRKLGFSARNTMSLAQRLYEGVVINGEQTGLITYMRTDSVNLSDEALSGIRAFISNVYTNDYLPKTSIKYSSKVKNAQEAHEAIRPSRFDLPPSKIKGQIDDNLYALYDLIWKRTIASQMTNAKFNQVIIDMANDVSSATFRASGSTLVFDGFLKVYDESLDEAVKNDQNDSDKQLLPDLNENDTVNLTDIVTAQHFTKPPFRYTEASLVKKLEELGIGRPSTYATILYVLQQRGYVKLRQKKFYIEDLGRFVTSFLKNFFSKYVEFDFTANLEQQLDDISNGQKSWKLVLHNFWDEFYKSIQSADKLRITDVINYLEKDLDDYLFKAQDNGVDRKCPKCGGMLGLKLGRYGAFIACSNYPDCSYTKRIQMDSQGDDKDNENLKQETDIFEERSLGELNGTSIILKKGPYGLYLSHQEGKKVKRTAIPKIISIEDLNYDLAVKLLSLPKKLGDFEGEDITIAIGPFGPYIKYDNKYYSVKDFSIFINMDLNTAIEFIKNAPKKKSLGKSKIDSKAKSTKRSKKETVNG